MGGIRASLDTWNGRHGVQKWQEDSQSSKGAADVLSWVSDHLTIPQADLNLLAWIQMAVGQSRLSEAEGHPDSCVLLLEAWT